MADVHLNFSNALDTVSWDSFPSGKSRPEGLNLLRCLVFIFFPFLRTADFLCSTKFLIVEAGLKCWHCKIMDCWAVTCLRFHFIIPHGLLFVLDKLYWWSITLLLPKGDTEEKVVVRNRTSPKLMFSLSPCAGSGEQRGQCGWVCWPQDISRTSWFHAAGLTHTQTKSTVSGKHYSTENLWIKDLEQVPYGGKSK